jgi:hypothetical protein
LRPALRFSWKWTRGDIPSGDIQIVTENDDLPRPPLRRERVEGHSAARAPDLDEVPPQWQAPLVPMPGLVERNVLWAAGRKAPSRLRIVCMPAVLGLGL